jgi:protein-S-isoprenylcysteine O-methyltransferase Ste14
MDPDRKSSARTPLASSSGTARGRVWFAIQGAIALAILLAPVFSRALWSPVLRTLGLVVAVLAILLLVWSYRALGDSHSPWTTPLDGATLVMTGPYRIVRHPVYAAYVLFGLGLEVMFASPGGLVAVLVGYIYYELRTREEERSLIERYPAYAAYRERVPGRLVPGIH